jgi:hypothetical protein
MAAKPKMIVSTQATSRRPSSAERHAAEVAWLSTRQAELKREAADRRARGVTKSTVDPAATRGV